MPYWIMPFPVHFRKTASALNVSDLNTLELRKMARNGFPESENFLMLSFGEDFYGIYGYCFEKSPELQSIDCLEFHKF
jgi:hypothetical protein